MIIEQDVLVGLLQDSLDAGQNPHLTIVSGSMAPLLRVGDQVILAHVSLADIAPGDVLILRGENLLFTHRLVTTLRHDGQRYWVTRGDRTLCYDPPWTDAQIVGRVCGRRRGGQTQRWDVGRGLWLNRHFGRLAQLEAKIFDNQPVCWSRLTQTEQLLIGSRWRNRWLRPIFLLIRTILQLWRRMLLLSIR
jgi:signal peptidase I